MKTIKISADTIPDKKAIHDITSEKVYLFLSQNKVDAITKMDVCIEFADNESIDTLIDILTSIKEAQNKLHKMKEGGK